MKIAIVAGDDLRRRPRLRWEAEALAAAGHRATAYGWLLPGTGQEEDRAGVVYVRAPVTGWRARGGALRRPLRLARWYDRFEEIVRLAVTRERPDAVHAHDLDVAVSAQAAALELRVPFVYEVTGAA